MDLVKNLGKVVIRPEWGWISGKEEKMTALEVRTILRSQTFLESFTI